MELPERDREENIKNALAHVKGGLQLQAQAVPSAFRILHCVIDFTAPKTAEKPRKRRESYLPKGQIKDFTQLIISHGNSTEVIGFNWVDRFLQRHDHIKTKISRSIEASRTLETTEEKIRDFYDRLDEQIKAKSVGTDRIYNCDETGMAEGETRAGKVVGTKMTKYSIVTDSDSREWATVLECISASGRRIKPLAILTGLNLQGQWFPDKFPDWAGGLPAADAAGKPVSMADPRPRRLLNPPHDRIYVYGLAQQDVGIFGPLKRAFREQTRGFASFSTRAPIQKQRFIQAYEIASRKALTKENIKSSFRAAGIYPTNVERVLEAVVRAKQPPALSPPRTPQPKSIMEKDCLWYTPRSMREVNSQLDLVRRNLCGVEHSLRTVAKKAGKELDRKNTMIAALTQRTNFLEAQLASREPTGRKAVEKDPNETFATIPEIAKAHFEAKQAAAKYEAEHGPTLAEDALEIARMNRESMMYEFQL
ncbi:hypothetical protein PT974_00572 [Cladobotryum mycophilum]|uniref:Transposase n=1 Tax=Cladobotryum mycophilum TaxID=491253 RepID=A0ABR0T1C2_9HYPO